MLAPKKETRYNAYLKKIENGFILKTVDSATGFESLIKFTSDLFMSSKEMLENISSKKTSKSSTAQLNEDDSCANVYSFLISSQAINKKLNGLRPCLSELQTNIPGFRVFEESSSNLDFQNPKVIFVANSELETDKPVNLKIPGKLMNVYYKGVINENSIVKFKADSVIKPITIVIGGYTININICHNLTSAKVSPNKLQHKNNDELTHCSKDGSKPLDEEKCTEIAEVYLNSKTNKINSNKITQGSSTQTDNESDTAIDSSSGRLDETITDVTVKKAPSYFENIEGENELAQLQQHSESNIFIKKCYTETDFTVGKYSDESTLKDNYNIEEIESKVSLPVNCEVSNESDISINKSNSPRNQSSESSVKTNVRQPYSSMCHISQSVTRKSFESHGTTKHDELFPSDYLATESKIDTFSADFNNSKCKSSCNSVPCIGNRINVSDLSGQKKLINRFPTKFENVLACNTEKSEDKYESFRKIKNKLTEASMSLNELCSAIESIENLSKKSISEETTRQNGFKMTCGTLNETFNQNKITQSNLKENYSNSSTSFSKSSVENPYNRSNEEDPQNEISINNSNREGTNLFLQKNNISEIQLKPCNRSNKVEKEEGITISDEVKDSSPPKNMSVVQTYDLKESPCEKNTFSEINFPLGTAMINHINSYTIQGIGGKLKYHVKGHSQSLGDLSVPKIPYFHSRYKTSTAPDSHLNDHLTKLTPKVLEKGSYQNNLEKCKSNVKSNTKEYCYPSKISGSFMMESDIMGFGYKPLNNNDNVASIRGNQKFYSETQISDPRMDSSKNSIKTIYFKSHFPSLNNLSLQVQHSSFKMFNNVKDHNEVGSYNESLSKTKSCSKDQLNKKSYKSIRKIIKKQLSKWNNKLWSFGESRNVKDVHVVSNSDISVENEKHVLSQIKVPRFLKVNSASEENVHQREVSDSTGDPGSTTSLDNTHKTFCPVNPSQHKHNTCLMVNSNSLQRKLYCQSNNS